MAKIPQGNVGKRKISLAPVKTHSEAPAMIEAVAPVVAAPKPVVVAPKVVTATPAPTAVLQALPVSAVIKPEIAKSVPAASKPVADKPAKAPSAPVLSLATIPMHPGLTDFDAETWFAPALNAVRAFAAVQGKVLDHACAELKASLAETEALARAASPSEVVALQAKALSRRLDSSSAHIADLVTTSRKTGKAA